MYACLVSPIRFTPVLPYLNLNARSKEQRRRTQCFSLHIARPNMLCAQSALKHRPKPCEVKAAKQLHCSWHTEDSARYHISPNYEASRAFVLGYSNCLGRNPTWQYPGHHITPGLSAPRQLHIPSRAKCIWHILRKLGL